MAPPDVRALDKRALAAQRGALYAAVGPGSYMVFLALFGLVFPPLLIGSAATMVVVGGVGATVGAATAEGPPQTMQDAVSTLQRAAIELKLEDALQGEVLTAAGRLTRYRFITLPPGTSFSGGTATLPAPAAVAHRDRSRDHVCRPRPGGELVSRSRRRSSRSHGRGSLAWGRPAPPTRAHWPTPAGDDRSPSGLRNRADPSGEELDLAVRSLAERIVDEVFLLHVP